MNRNQPSSPEHTKRCWMRGSYAQQTVFCFEYVTVLVVLVLVVLVFCSYLILVCDRSHLLDRRKKESCMCGKGYLLQINSSKLQWRWLTIPFGGYVQPMPCFSATFYSH